MRKNKEINKVKFIHNQCRTELRNAFRKILSTMEYVNSSNKRISTRSESKCFDFKTQCFYCESPCVVDFKHPDRNKFEEVRTRDTMIHKNTLAICKNRNDKQGKSIEGRLLVLNDLVAAEATYNVSCRVNFEKPVPQNKTLGCPVSTEKVTIFNKACEILEEDVEMYAVSEFHNIMSSIGNNIFTLKMTQQKLEEKYGDSMELVTRDGKSNIIFSLNNRSLQ